MVVLFNGYNPVMSMNMLTWAGAQLAAKGFVVATCYPSDSSLLDPAQWKDGILNTINWMLARNTSNYLAYNIQGMMDTGRIAAGGHSQGGVAALWAAGLDARIKCVLSMAPPSPSMPIATSGYFAGNDPAITFAPVIAAVPDITRPTMIICDDKDTCVPPVYDLTYYDALPVSREIITVHSTNTGANVAGHVDYLDNISLGGLMGYPQDTNARAVIQNYAVNWLSYWLQGNPAAYEAICGAGAQADLASGKLVQLDFEV